MYENIYIHFLNEYLIFPLTKSFVEYKNWNTIGNCDLILFCNKIFQLLYLTKGFVRGKIKYLFFK